MASASASPSKEFEALVIDCGAEWCKSGFVGDDAPRSVMRTVVGRPRHKGVFVGAAAKDVYVGEEALSKRGILTLQSPIECGAVKDWDAMEKIWNAIFKNELRVAPEEYGVLFAEAPNHRKMDREKHTQIMFEGFRLPAMFLSPAAALSLYASGRDTGLVVDSGADCTWITPVFEGYALPLGSYQLNVAGSAITEHLRRLLQEKGHSFTTSSERELVRAMKEEHAYLCMDIEDELRKEAGSIETKFELPDGQREADTRATGPWRASCLITLGPERFRCSEPLFRPGLIGLSEHGLDYSLWWWVNRLDRDLHASMFDNIVLAGSGTLFAGFAERLTRCVKMYLKKDATVKVVAPPERKYSAWIGGSIAASLSIFKSMWITKQEYDDMGVSVVSRKCF